MGQFLIPALLLGLSVAGYGAETLPTPDWKKLRLNDYLKDLAPDQNIKSSETLSGPKRKFFVVQKKNAQGMEEPLIQLFDFDGDGNIDLAKHFRNGRVERSEWNLDRDEYVESIKYYDLKTGQLQLKVESEGEGYIWSHYFKEELRRQEFDRNGDRKPDMWYYFRAGKLYRAEVAKKFDPKKIEDITQDVLKQ